MNSCEWCGTEVAFSGGACSVDCWAKVAGIMAEHAQSVPLVRIAASLDLEPAVVDRVIQAASERMHRESQGDGFVREWARAALSYRRYEQYWADVAMDLGEENPSVRNKASDNQHKALAALDKLYDLHAPEKHVKASLPVIELEFVQTGKEDAA